MGAGVGQLHQYVATGTRGPRLWCPGWTGSRIPGCACALPCHLLRSCLVTGSKNAGWENGLEFQLQVVSAQGHLQVNG